MIEENINRLTLPSPPSPSSGFIPQTLCEDNDPLDVLVLMQASKRGGERWKK